ncbi:MAG: UDP-N-acetylenolpyruvoylglucosamine reductase [Gemmatimonadetes bacterium SCN 70-22]|jgi:UDP-N-acetylmuramate dehydrogenase|nr:MAG: UDP-N-acetylenolpyruvoylglucosamine reductase [Gemmatimonadetes bacterium SCN 70-22]
MTKTPATVAAFVDAARRTLDCEHLRRDEVLAPYTTFKIGGPADVMYDATSADDLAEAVLLARATATPYFILGLGANILVGDKGFRGVVIRNRAAAHSPVGETGLRAESGATIRDLIFIAIGRGLSGLEHYIGIPSTVGGAVWQNLHFLSPAPGRERTMFIAEVVESVELLTEKGERSTVDQGAMAFGYDTSRLHHTRDVALAVTFRLTPGDPFVMHRILQENLSWRGARHPWLDIHPSAGSIFKKIEGVGAGRLIDQCGLKGFRIGGAQVSHIHANIMVNLGGATAADVRALIAHVQQAVEARHGLHLDPEVGFVGEF